MHFGRILRRRESVTDATQQRHSAAVLDDRIRLLFGGSLGSILVSIAVAALYLRALTQHSDSRLPLLWFSGIVLLLIGRGLLSSLFHRHPQICREPETWLRWFRNGASLTAGMWGIAGVLFFPTDNVLLQAMTILVLSGVAAGALSVLTADFATYRNFVLLTLAPVVTHAFSMDGEMPTLIGMLGLLLITFLLKSGKQNSDAIIESLTLRHHNALLAEDLAKEKEDALGEAATMMSTVLSSAPIALWAIDGNGVITFMEGSEFGRKTRRQLPGIGENLFQAFDDFPQIAYQTRRALNGESFSTEIEMGQHTFEVHFSALDKEQDDTQGVIGVAIDISDRIEHKRELSRRAHYDQLTGLPNRTLIMSQIGHAFENARRHHSQVALFFLDLDNFKAINDSMGHAAGDELLRQAAERLQSAVRQNDMPARLGGDEFLVVSEDMQRPEDAEVIAHKIARLFQRPFRIEGREVFTTTSIGIAIHPQDGSTADQMLQSADTAMYHAKAEGKNKYRFFTREMQDSVERHLAMETELRQALRRNELQLMFQPKYDSRDGRIRGAEALLRWHSPTLGQVKPDDFIPVAEYAGLMPQIGNWVLQQACREAAEWDAIRSGNLHIAINVSPQQFRNTDLLANVTQALAETGIAPQCLELEITESVLVQDAPETMRVFQDLNDLGITLSLDDFGTGYSSLSYLKKFPMQVLKIDKAFIQDLGRDPDDDSLVDAIVAMAHSLNLSVVAEGVETQQQFEFLRQRNVELVQGYYFSRPVPADEFRAMLEAEAEQGSRLASGTLGKPG
ncbi:MAG: EAL domain-containing protein [Gammaproteobacteria bacterium]|nr:EAL domain-containing protein [Gammaproteobacteria bacterium]